MSEFINNLFSWIRPPNPSVLLEIVHNSDPTVMERVGEYIVDVRSWYTKMTTCSVLSVCFGIWAASPVGFARVSDVRAQIQEVLEPLSVQVHKLSTSTELLTGAVYRQLSSQASEQICRLVLRLNKEENFDERRRLRTEIDVTQEVYRQYSITKSDYPEARCGG